NVFPGWSAAENRREDEIESLAGLRTSLGKHWAWSLDAASYNGANAYSSEIRGMDKNWEVWLRNLTLEGGYGVNIITAEDGYIESEEHDHYMQSLYQVFESLRLGLFGRDAKRRLVKDIKYVLPGFYFNPGYSLSLSAVPNLEGEYRVTGLYGLSSNKRLSLIFENHQYNVSMYYDMSPRQNFSAVYEYNDITRDAIGLVNFYWFFHDANESYLNFGVSHNADYPGMIAGMQWMITPGMELGLEYTNGYHRTSMANRSQTFSAKFRLGIANTEDGFTPVQNSLLSFVRGGLSGAVYSSTGAKLDVGDVEVLINGARISQIMAGGRFFVGNLKPGIYLVEIDEGTLPIEFKIERRFFRVEVSPGVVTQVNFTAMAYYGVAGKVEWSDGAPVSRAMVRAYDTEGKSAGVGLTDQFGYYRIDNLAPGEKRLIVEAVAGEPLDEPRPAIRVVIEDDYIFDQNIDLFEPPAPDHSPKP
ncbi:MAG: carboxypeptidase regulatory-like domain-containing protein, partial [Nitrospinota bacterium]|nr:carboxypeptidase regulatory-like domain-containing protein [Nitrospinota bacterium]